MGHILTICYDKNTIHYVKFVFLKCSKISGHLSYYHKKSYVKTNSYYSSMFYMQLSLNIPHTIFADRDNISFLDER